MYLFIFGFIDHVYFNKYVKATVPGINIIPGTGM